MNDNLTNKEIIFHDIQERIRLLAEKCINDARKHGVTIKDYSRDSQ